MNVYPFNPPSRAGPGVAPSPTLPYYTLFNSSAQAPAVLDNTVFLTYNNGSDPTVTTRTVTPSFRGGLPVTIKESQRYAVLCNKATVATGGSPTNLVDILKIQNVAAENRAAANNKYNPNPMLDAIVLTVYMPVVTFVNSTDRPMWVDGIANPQTLFPLPAVVAVPNNTINSPYNVNVLEIPVVDVPAVNVYTETQSMALQDMANMYATVTNTSNGFAILQSSPLPVCVYTFPSVDGVPIIYRTAYGSLEPSSSTEGGTPFFPGSTIASSNPPLPVAFQPASYLQLECTVQFSSGNRPASWPSAALSSSVRRQRKLFDVPVAEPPTVTAAALLLQPMLGMYSSRFLLNGAADMEPTPLGSSDTAIPQSNCLTAIGGGVVFATMPTFNILNDTDTDIVVSGAEGNSATLRARTLDTVSAFLCAVSDLQFVLLQLNSSEGTPYMFNGDFSTPLNTTVLNTSGVQLQGYLLTADCSGCASCTADTTVSGTTTWNFLPNDCKGGECVPDMQLTPGADDTPIKRPHATFNSLTPCSQCTKCDDARYPVLYEATPPLVMKINAGTWATGATQVVGPYGPYGTVFCASSADTLTHFFADVNPNPAGAIPVGLNADFILGSRPWQISNPLLTQPPGYSVSLAAPAIPSSYSLFANGTATGIPNTLGAGAVLCQTYWDATSAVSKITSGTLVQDILPFDDASTYSIAEPSAITEAAGPGAYEPGPALPAAPSPVGSDLCTDYFGLFGQIATGSVGSPKPPYWHWPRPQPTPSPIGALHILRPTVVLTNKTSFTFTIHAKWITGGFKLAPTETYTFCLSDYITPANWSINVSVETGSSGTYTCAFSVPATVQDSVTKTNSFLQTKYLYPPGIFNNRFYLTPSIDPNASPLPTSLATTEIKVSLNDIVAGCTNLLPITGGNTTTCVGVITNETSAPQPNSGGGQGAITAVDVIVTVATVQIVPLPQYQQALSGINNMAVALTPYTQSTTSFDPPNITFTVPDDPDNANQQSAIVYKPASAAPWMCTASSPGNTSNSTFIYYCTPAMNTSTLGFEFVQWTISRNYNLPVGSCIVQNALNAPYEIKGQVYQGFTPIGTGGEANISSTPCTPAITCQSNDLPSLAPSAPGRSSFITACPCIGQICTCVPGDPFVVHPLDADFIAGDPRQPWITTPPSRSKQCTLTDGVSAMALGDRISNDTLALKKGNLKLFAGPDDVVHFCGHKKATNQLNDYSVLELQLQANSALMPPGGLAGGSLMTGDPVPIDGANLYGVYLPVSTTGLNALLLPSGCGVLHAPSLNPLISSARKTDNDAYNPPAAPTGPDLPGNLISLSYVDSIPVSLTTTDNMTFTVRAPLPVGQDMPYIPPPQVNQVALCNTLVGDITWSLWPDLSTWSNNVASAYVTKALSSGSLYSFMSSVIQLPPGSSMANPAVLQVTLNPHAGNWTGFGKGLPVLALAVYSGQQFANASGVKCTPEQITPRKLCSRIPMQGASTQAQFISLTQLTSPQVFAVTAPYPLGNNPTVFPSGGWAVTLVNENSFPVVVTKTQNEPFQSSLYDVNGNAKTVTLAPAGLPGCSYNIVGYKDSSYTFTSNELGTLQTGQLGDLGSQSWVTAVPSGSANPAILDGVNLQTKPISCVTLTVQNIVSGFTFSMNSLSPGCGPASVTIIYTDALGAKKTQQTLARGGGALNTTATFTSSTYPFPSSNETFTVIDTSTHSSSVIPLSQFITPGDVFFDNNLLEITGTDYTPTQSNAFCVSMTIEVNCMWPIVVNLARPCAPVTCDFYAVVSVYHSVSSIRRLQSFTAHKSKKFGRLQSVGTPTLGDPSQIIKLTSSDYSTTFTLINTADSFSVQSYYYGNMAPLAGPYTPQEMGSWKVNDTNGTVSLMYTALVPHTMTVLCLPPNVGPSQSPGSAGYPPYTPPSGRKLPVWAIVVIVLGSVALLGFGVFLYQKYYGKSKARGGALRVNVRGKAPPRALLR
jgi:hypothetical protein